MLSMNRNVVVFCLSLLALGCSASASSLQGDYSQPHGSYDMVFNGPTGVRYEVWRLSDAPPPGCTGSWTVSTTQVDTLNIERQCAGADGDQYNGSITSSDATNASYTGALEITRIYFGSFGLTNVTATQNGDE